MGAGRGQGIVAGLGDTGIEQARASYSGAVGREEPCDVHGADGEKLVVAWARRAGAGGAGGGRGEEVRQVSCGDSNNWRKRNDGVKANAIHHIDGNLWNNDPDNLQIVRADKHVSRNASRNSNRDSLIIPTSTTINGMTFRRVSEYLPTGRVKVRIEVSTGGHVVGTIRQQQGGWTFWPKGRLGTAAWLRSGEGKVWKECGELKRVVAGAGAEAEESMTEEVRKREAENDDHEGT